MNELAGLYTDQQRDEIIEAAKAFDEELEAEIQAQKNPPQLPNSHDEIRRTLYPTLEERKEDILEEIRFAQDEIAELVRVRDTFHSDDFTREYANMLVRVWLYKIEDLQGELCR
ncbi:MAG: hypothetical protein M0P57_15015 [Syntrophales bacterium]|nr:hypothetical protein [Syntrophales bacterium]MDY0044418.1 hypothetical protein [Syntrophales bacterium]